MSVRTAQLAKGLKTAAGAVKDFGAKAAASTGSFGATMAPAGRFGAAVGRLGLAEAAGGFRAMSGAIRGTVGGLRAGLGALGGWQTRLLALGAGGLLYEVAKAASNLFEQSSRTSIMFGDSAGYVRKEVDAMAGAFGIARAESLATTSAMAGMFQGIGYGRKESAQLSVHFLKLATDLSSIANIPVAEALEKIQSGIAGEVRPLREVGVFLSEAAIKEKAAAMGIAKLGTELTEAQKVQTRVALITEKLGYANGDLARTADSAENATRGFMGRLQGLAETIGTALLPIVGSAMSQLQVGVEALSAAWSGWASGVLTDQAGVVGAVGVTAESMGYLQKSVGFVADAFQALKIGFYAVQSFITGGIGRIVSGLAGLVGALDRVLMAVGGVKTGIGDFLESYGNDLKKLSAQQYETFQSQLAAPAASEGVNAAFAAAQSRIKAMRTEAMRPGVDVSRIAPASTAPAKAVESKFASAAAAGSQDATNAILRSRFGGGGARGPAESTAKNTAKANDLLTQAVGGINRLVGQRFDAAAGALGGLF